MSKGKLQARLDKLATSPQVKQAQLDAKWRAACQSGDRSALTDAELAECLNRELAPYGLRLVRDNGNDPGLTVAEVMAIIEAANAQGQATSAA